MLYFFYRKLCVCIVLFCFIGCSVLIAGTKHLVVAYCKEDLGWLVKESLNYDHVYLYSKCDQKDVFKKFSNIENVSINVLPNIGSCDYVYLTYIISHWHDMADIIDFSKGTYYEDKIPVFSCNYVCNRHTCHNIFSSFRLPSFSLKKWFFMHNPGQEFVFVKSPHKNLRAWLEDTLGLEKSKELLSWSRRSCVIYKGYFSTTRSSIKKHEQSLYWLLRGTQKYPNEEVDHFIERVWGLLLGLV